MSMEMKLEQLRLNQEKEELKVKSLLEQSIARQKVLTEYEEQRSDRSIFSEKNKDTVTNSLYQYSRSLLTFQCMVHQNHLKQKTMTL